MTTHIRIGVVRASRQINGSRGLPGRPLCGAGEITAEDVEIRDALRARQAGDLDRWMTCEACRTAFERMTAGQWRAAAKRSRGERTPGDDDPVPVNYEREVRRRG